MEWGSATDSARIYVAIGNFYRTPYGNGITAGSWTALDPATGKILWQTPDPNGAIDIGPMTVANGVVYAPSMGAATPETPNMFALDANNGNVLWSYASGGSVNAGAVVSNGVVDWGSGYATLAHLGLPVGVGNNRCYAFTLGGK
jgi:polyvinyl alcohol dehydrogenase (cytochrome)